MPTDVTRPIGAQSSRVAGIALVAASALMVGFVALHPRAHSHGSGDFVRAVADVAAMNATVHGSLVGLFVFLLYGFSVFADLVGAGRPLVRLGLVAYVLGAVPLVAAALTSGFVVPDFVERYAGKGDADLAGMHHALRLAHSVIQGYSKIGVVAMSVGVAAWGLSLLGRRRSLALVGVLAGALPVTLLAVGHLPMNVHGMLAFVTAQAIWGIAVGVPMARDNLQMEDYMP